MAISRIGMSMLSAEAWSNENLVAATDSTISSRGTPVDNTHASTSRNTTPGRLKFSGTPARNAATATGRNTRSACR